MNYENHDRTKWNELLFLMPLIQTAWAHGAVAGKERRLIFDAAREDGIDATSEMNRHLHELLMNQPSQRFFDERLDEIAFALEEMTVNERTAVRQRILSRCRGVAESAAGNDPMDVRAFVTSAEQRAIEEICSRLGIENGMPEHESLIHETPRTLRYMRT